MKKATESAGPFSGWHLQSKWGGYRAYSWQQNPKMEKGVFQCTSIEIPLSYNKSFL